LVRSEERTFSVAENKASFRTTNIIPQLPELNQQTWLKLEYYAEKLAKDSLKEMYIYVGSVFAKNKIVTKYKDKIAIPDSCFKIIVVMPFGSKITDVNENTQIIACIFPNNDPTVKNHDWTEFKTTVAHIEESTGLDFLSALPKQLQDKLEGRLTNVNETKSTDMLLFPNPATDYLNIQSDNYTVYNSFGVEISKSSEKLFNTSSLPNGVYFVRTEGGILKFVK
jgi:DNA/RNA endonuclease G (NUC1)